jgi:Xaa-Pro aminopeptidase
VSRDSRRQQALSLLDRLGGNSLLLRRPANFAWYTDGGDNRVDHASPIGVADVVITRDGDFVLTTNIEADRIRQEQTPGYDVVRYPWYGDVREAAREITGDVPLVSDAPFPGAREHSDEIAALRWVLDEEAIRRYHAVGADASRALAEAAARILPGATELDAAAEIAAACRRRGLFSPVILVAADDRIERYRHPVPGSATIQQRAMLVVCAERGGLYANLTQFVDFDEPSPEVRRRTELCEEILRRMREEATRPGRTLGEAFADCRRYYAEAGFPDEWMLHHQGGTTGYASREVVATPDSPVRIEAGQAFAWNPSITGGKAEETFLLTADGPVVLARARA